MFGIFICYISFQSLSTALFLYNCHIPLSFWITSCWLQKKAPKRIHSFKFHSFVYKTDFTSHYMMWPSYWTVQKPLYYAKYMKMPSYNNCPYTYLFPPLGTSLPALGPLGLYDTLWCTPCDEEVRHISPEQRDMLFIQGICYLFVSIATSETSIILHLPFLWYLHY